ncbi:MAG: sodium:solute symporter, partial [Bacteroidota bacterium]
QVGIDIPEKRDLLYPTIALQHLSPTIGIVFILGLIAAAYSSADSALTALTTSFCVDFLGFEKSDAPEAEKKQTRFKVHIGFSFLLFLVIFIFWFINDESVIAALFKVAGYTYGPLLGLYAFGFYTKRTLVDKFAPYVCFAAPVLTYIINANSELLLFGYQFGFEQLILNGLLTFLGLWGISYAAVAEETE